jgi:hypothetical protein
VFNIQDSAETAANNPKQNASGLSDVKSKLMPSIRLCWISVPVIPVQSTYMANETFPNITKLLLECC